MKDGHCPMCKSTEVYANEAYHFVLRLQGPVGVENIIAGLIPYICKSCGFTALYVKDVEADFDNLTPKLGWKQVA